MNTAQQLTKIGGFLGFTLVFVFILWKDRDITIALRDASISCLILAFTFKLLSSYMQSMITQVKLRNIQEAEQIEEVADSHNPELQSLTEQQS